MTDFNSPEYKRSRKAYLLESAFEYFIALLVSDAFLAKLLSSIGISDALNGIISSFISLVFITDLFSLFLLQLKIETKRLVIISKTLSNVFFMLLYTVPFLDIGKSGKTVLVIIYILLGYVGLYLVNSICYKWANSSVAPTNRANYSAVKEIVSLISGILFSIAAGKIVDSFETKGDLTGGFLFIAAAILLLNICDFICLLLIRREDASQDGTETKKFGDVIKNTLGNKAFRNVVILAVLWDSARYFSIGFMGIYKTADLMLTVAAVQVINMIANGARLLITKPLGVYSDKRSFAKGVEAGLILAAAAFFVNIFTTPSRWFLIVVFTVLYNASFAGVNANNFNITYSYVNSAYITQAMAIKNCLGGIFGFAASLAGGKIVSLVQAAGNEVFGFHVYAQQILSAISFVITAITVIFMHRVICRQKVKIQ